MRRISIIAAAVLILIVAATASAQGRWVTAQTAQFYEVESCNSDSVTDSVVDGWVRIVDPMGDVTMVVQGHVKGLQPDTEYTVWLRDLAGYSGDSVDIYTPLGYFAFGAFTTDEYGTGNFHFNLRATDLPEGTYTVQVALNYANGTAHGCTEIATPWNNGDDAMTVTIRSAE